IFFFQAEAGIRYWSVTGVQSVLFRSSNVTLSGFVANFDSEVHTYSAKAPRQEPNTSSPGLNCATFLPHDSTWPATSTPGRVNLRSEERRVGKEGRVRWCAQMVRV